jgi:hypothetical protein
MKTAAIDQKYINKVLKKVREISNRDFNRWERQEANRLLWQKAVVNAPHKIGCGPFGPGLPIEAMTWLSKINSLATCLNVYPYRVQEAINKGTKVRGERWEMLQKLANPYYGRVFAAIRLTALGVADQYDWGDNEQIFKPE